MTQGQAVLSRLTSSTRHCLCLGLGGRTGAQWTVASGLLISSADAANRNILQLPRCITPQPEVRPQWWFAVTHGMLADCWALFCCLPNHCLLPIMPYSSPYSLPCCLHDIMRLMASSNSQVRLLMFTWTLTNCIIDSVDQLEKALAAAVCAAQPTFLQVGQLLLLEVLTSWQPLLLACSHAAYDIHLLRYLQHLLNVPAVKIFSCPKLPV